MLYRGRKSTSANRTTPNSSARTSRPLVREKRPHMVLPHYAAAERVANAIDVRADLVWHLSGTDQWFVAKGDTMRTITIILRTFLGLIFLIFGMNGLLHFLPM